MTYPGYIQYTTKSSFADNLFFKNAQITVILFSVILNFLDDRLFSRKFQIKKSRSKTLPMGKSLSLKISAWLL